MKKFIIAIAVVVTFSITFTDLSIAVCVQGPPNTYTCNTNPPNPDLNGVDDFSGNDVTVNVLPGAGINTLDMPTTDAIDTGNGSDNITITGGDLRASEEGVCSSGGGDNIMVEDSFISSVCEAINTGNGGDTVTVINSEIISQECEIISTGNDNDNVTVTDSVITSLESVGINSGGISTGNGNDTVTVINSGITAGGGSDAVNLGNNNDTLTLGTGADLNSLIDCGNGFDTLIFTMDVPEDDLAFLSSQITAATLPDGSITINGLFYEWERCELLVNELVGVIPPVSNVPTLSEWGLIAMAGALGIVGFMVMRRRKVTA